MEMVIVSVPQVLQGHDVPRVAWRPAGGPSGSAGPGASVRAAVAGAVGDGPAGPAPLLPGYGP
ncbi:hypothetical protein GCM10009839_34160 [Catenulispora yoronensis]|uniref:Uncharacterized protein n=1 Tax=Catenulispora yoronensis TaxID=450799 RepID=A0ABP5FQ95_9ACTN